LTDDELRHLRRCVELATEALEAGDEPFGSVLVAAHGWVGLGRIVQGPVPGLSEAVHDLIRRFQGAA
jgi:tRNA(Arg) A34 adenosine deaminase TadA